MEGQASLVLAAPPVAVGQPSGVQSIIASRRISFMFDPLEILSSSAQ